MSNKVYTLSLLSALALLLSACFALEKPEESSGAVSAPTLAAEEAALAEADAASTAIPEEGLEAPPTSPPADETAETAESYPMEEEAAAPPATELPPGYPAGETSLAESLGSAVYEIDPAQSEARFTIHEVLRGAPTTVVGTSKNLGGQIALDLANPATAQVGTILIDARNLATDNEFRNRAIANEILHTNQYEFITFEPTAISGLPEAVVIGETYPLQITGNLTITDQTREVTFDTQVTPLSESELQGTASLDILYADFGITIPFARAVESVEDNVLLELDFIAVQS